MSCETTVASGTPPNTKSATASTRSGSNDRDYDSVVIVVFDEDFQVTEALKLSRGVVEELFGRRPYVNGRIITVTKMLRADPRVEALDLSAAALGLHR